jgi:hypothetical protein
MAAPDSTKFQVNFKTSDGSLINLYATDIKELETGLTDLSMVASLIKSTSTELNGGTAAAVAAVTAAFPSAAPINRLDDRVNPPSDAPICKHGAMQFKTGTSARGPWKAWMCPSPKGAVDKCETSWIR